MGLLSWMGITKPSVTPEEVKREPVVLDQVAEGLEAKPEPKPKPKPQRTEAEQIMLDEHSAIDNVLKAIDESQDKLYDRRAQLSVEEKSMMAIAEEIEGHEAHLKDVQERALVASNTDKRSLINEGQRVQKILKRKKSTLQGLKDSIDIFEKVIDDLEDNLGRLEVQVNTRQAGLKIVETMYDSHLLTETMNNNLSSVSFSPEDNKLQLLSEKIKIKMEDVNAEMAGASYVGQEALTFREQVEAAEITDVPEVEVIPHEK